MCNEVEFKILVDESKSTAFEARVKVRKYYEEELVRNKIEEHFKLMTLTERLAMKKIGKINFLQKKIGCKEND